MLEAGSTLGFMVFPALEPHESYYIEFQGEGQYLFTYFQSNALGKWDPLFSVLVVLPLGGIGMTREEVKFAVNSAPISVEDAKLVMRAFLVPEDLGTPAGGISLRGATNFRTPPGWDTVYTPIFNMIERPVAPALVVRVETDWFAHEIRVPLRAAAGGGFPARIPCLLVRSSLCRVKTSPCGTAPKPSSPLFRKSKSRSSSGKARPGARSRRRTA